MFNVHIQSKPDMGTGNKGGGSKGGPPALAGTREYEQFNWNRLQVEGILVLVLSAVMFC